MKYELDRVIDRKGTGSLKWDATKKFLGAEDVIPLWVADMDFASPPEVIDALKQRLEFPVFGYPIPSEAFFESIINWFGRRHKWKIDRDLLVYAPGVIPALNMAIRAFTDPGDKIIVQPPVYFPFYQSIRNNNREVLENDLLYSNGKYMMNYQLLEQQLPEAKMLILCSPHNPVGRVWTKEELERLIALSKKNDIMIVADEIHCDLILEGNEHIPLLSLVEEMDFKGISLTSPAKSFNLQSFQMAGIVFSGKKLLEEYKIEEKKNTLHLLNEMGMIATTAAYNDGEEWLNELLLYLQENRSYLDSFLKENIPAIKLIPSEATYLAWLDCTAMGLSTDELNEKLSAAGVGLLKGTFFGKGGEGFMRLNFGCPRKTLDEALERMKNALI